MIKSNKSNLTYRTIYHNEIHQLLESKSVVSSSPSKGKRPKRYLCGCENNHLNFVEFLHNAMAFISTLSRLSQRSSIETHIIHSKCFVSN